MQSNRGYEPSEFKFLIGTRHIDPENGLPYCIEKVGRYRNKLITIQRKLINLQSGQTTGATDVIHALDAMTYYLLCNPNVPCPLLNNDIPTISQLNQYLSNITEIKHTSRGTKARSKRKRADTLYNDNSLGPNKDSLDSVPASTGDSRDANYIFRRSKRLRDLSAKVYLMHTRTTPLDEINASDVPIPRTYEEAMRSTFAAYWRKAIEEEIEALKKRGVFIPSTLPDGEIVLPHLWVFAVKADSTGRVVRFKARLTARGDKYDSSDLDFQEIFSPVVSWEGMRTYLALTVLLGLIPLQLDVDLAYLYADLDKPVYMKAPQGSGCPSGHVWKLKKSLYGLPQSGCNWHKLISSVLLDSDFELTQLISDTCLYIKSKSDGTIILLCIYVDDIYLATKTIEQQKEIVAKLQTIFRLKILGVPDQLLGLTLSWGEGFRSVHIHVGKTIRKIMRYLDIYDSNGIIVPMDPALKLSRLQCPTEEEIKANHKSWKLFTKRYQRICGSVIFCMNVCRPDIAYAVGVLTRQMHNPAETYMKAAIDLVHYLAGTVELGIIFRTSGNARPLVYCDSDRSGDESRKSTAGHVLLLAGGPLAWRSELIDNYSCSHSTLHSASVGRNLSPSSTYAY